MRQRETSLEALLARSCARPVVAVLATAEAERGPINRLIARLKHALGAPDVAVVDRERARRLANGLLATARLRGLPTPPPQAPWTIVVLRDSAAAALLHADQAEPEIGAIVRRLAAARRRPSGLDRARQVLARLSTPGRRWATAAAGIAIAVAVPSVAALWLWHTEPPVRTTAVMRVRAAPAAVAFPVPPDLRYEAPPLVLPAPQAALPPVPPPAFVPDTTPEPSFDTVWAQPRDALARARRTTLVMVGDIMMGSDYQDRSGLNPLLDGSVPIERVLSPELLALLRSADATFGNLEGVLSDVPGTAGAKDCRRDCYVFRMPTAYAGLLAAAGFDFLSLANNHAGDLGEEGRLASVRALRAQGIAVAGASARGRKLPDAETAIGVLADGRRIGFAAFAPNSGSVRMEDLDGMQRRVADLARHAELVVVSVHAGGEGAAYARVPEGTEVYLGESRGNARAFARAAIDAGADVVFGHGPHVPRGVERYKGKPIAYSLGNFWVYKGISRSGLSGVAPVLRVTLAGDAPPDVEIWSVRQGPRGVPVLDADERALKEMRQLTALDFPQTGDALRGPDSELRRLLAAVQAGSAAPAE